MWKFGSAWNWVFIAAALWIVIEWAVTDEYQEVVDHCNQEIASYGLSPTEFCP